MVAVEHSSLNYRLFALSPTNEISSTKQIDENNYRIDRQELLGLKAEGLVTLRSYVYFALRIDGIEQKIHQIVTADFCNRWCIIDSDYLLAIASLKKKGVINIETIWNPCYPYPVIFYSKISIFSPQKLFTQRTRISCF